MGREVERVRPKSLILPALLHWHRSALRYDLARIGVEMDGLSWNRLWDFVVEIRRDLSSHLVAAMEGHKYVPSDAERASWATFEMWVNTQTPRGSGTKRMQRPWAGKRPTYRTEPVMTPDRLARREKLAALF